MKRREFCCALGSRLLRWIVAAVSAGIASACLGLEEPFFVSQSQTEIGKVKVENYGKKLHLAQGGIDIPGIRMKSQAALMMKQVDGSKVKIFEIEQEWDKFGSMAWHARMCRIVDAKSLGDNAVCCAYYSQNQLRVALLRKIEGAWVHQLDLMLNIPLASFGSAEILEAKDNKIRLRLIKVGSETILPEGQNNNTHDSQGSKEIEVDLS